MDFFLFKQQARNYASKNGKIYQLQIHFFHDFTRQSFKNQYFWKKNFFFTHLPLFWIALFETNLRWEM